MKILKVSFELIDETEVTRGVLASIKRTIPFDWEGQKNAEEKLKECLEAVKIAS